jgi:hypothetical protein
MILPFDTLTGLLTESSMRVLAWGIKLSDGRFHAEPNWDYVLTKEAIAETLAPWAVKSQRLDMKVLSDREQRRPEAAREPIVPRSNHP